MDGPSSRLNAFEAGPQKVANRKDSEADSEPDAAGDIKTHFRVCRFVMETGSRSFCSPGCPRALTRCCGCLPRGEAGPALRPRGHRVRPLPPLLPARQPGGLRALPGGHELSVPGWKDRGAAPQDSGYNQRKPQVRRPPESLGPRAPGAPGVPAASLCPLLLCRYFHPGSAPLECDKDFWDLRDSVVQCELLILRQLNFYVSFEHPHKVCVRVCVAWPGSSPRSGVYSPACVSSSSTCFTT